MNKIKISLEELKAAIAEMEARTNDLFVNMEVDGRQLRMMVSDKGDNIVEAILFEDSNLGAQFRCTERLMFMKDKKRI